MSRKPKPSHWENLVTIFGPFGIGVAPGIGAAPAMAGIAGRQPDLSIEPICDGETGWRRRSGT